MSHHNGISGSQLLLAFITGAVTGATVALLASPQSGPEVRNSIKGWANDAQGRATRVPETLKGAYSRASRAAKSAFTKELDRDVDGAADVAADMPAEVQTQET